MSQTPEDEIGRIHRALEAVEGNRSLAAEILEMDPRALKSKIHACPRLRDRWVNSDQMAKPAEIPTEVAVLSRPPVENPLAPAMNAEDARLKMGLKGLKLDEEELALALSLQSFHGRNFRQSLEIVNGGATRSSLKLQTQFDKTAMRLEPVRRALMDMEFDDPARMALVVEEKQLSDALMSFSNMSAKMADVANRGALSLAIAHQKAGGGGNEKRRGKPGFSEIVDVTPTKGKPE